MLDQFKKITCFVFDMDGVLTDGTILVMNDGQHARRMNIKDGFALQLAVKKGYHIMVVSGSISEAAVIRLNKLGITEVHMSVLDKKKLVTDYLIKNEIDWNEVLVMGDDIPDLEILEKAGLSCCPADAVPEVRNISHYISGRNGGEACVREVIEKVLRCNDHWNFDKNIAST
jgi:3-deoxy-D-manno-octulosonate 8-phosphate phosphatase (KDO 8-P phosphatase)